jgi:isopenicillin-N epimerase
MRPEDFGFVTNATGGINAVLRSLRLDPGDELVTTTHVYNAIRQTMKFVAQRQGGTVHEVHVPLPVQSASDVIGPIEAVLNERTRLLVIDLVTSPTALRLPLERMIAQCAERNIDVLIDGAHAPGMIELDVPALGAAYFAGNLHKWVCAPLGTAVLWVRPDRQAGVHPTTISHFYEEGLAVEFGWQGTRDISGWLAAPAAIEYFDALGWDRVRRHNHDLAVWAQRLLTRRWDMPPVSPLDGSWLGSMATVELPPTLRGRYRTPEDLQGMLMDEHRIEVPVIDWDDRWYVRVSCQIYNRSEQYEMLAEALTRGS